MAALRLLHIECGYTDPTADSLLQYTIKGIKRSQSSQTRERLPITISLLRQLKQALHDCASIPTQDKRMLWAAFCTAFYGFLRASEFCSPSSRSFSPDRTLCLADITLAPSRVQLHIKASKTDPFRHSCTVTIGATLSSTCPVSALQKYIDLRPAAPANTPLFIFQDGTFLTRPSLTRHLRLLLQPIEGVTPTSFASHSFRIGAATTAAAAGLPDWQIQARGRWTSDCYTRYIRIPPATLASASAVLAGSTTT